MNLQGKRLLLMGGAAFANDIRKYADETGFVMVACGNTPGRHTRLSHEYYPVNTTDVDGIVKLVREKQIDGLFVGAAEVNIRPAIRVAEKTGIPFYVTQAQWDALSDKASFKKLLKKHDLPVIPEYSEDTDPADIDYPVIIKPVDGSGARGISVSRNAEEFTAGIKKAKEASFSGKVIIEKFMQGMKDVFIHYRLQDGEYKVFNSFDKYADFSKGGFTGMPLIHKYPSSYLTQYLEKCDQKMQAIFRELGLQNGVLNLQGFLDEKGDFYFYEAGYRLGGCQSYLFTDAVNRANGLHYMINFALTGKMADTRISERDDPYFKKACCAQYIPLNPGILTEIIGLDELRNTPGILNITEMCEVGEEIKQVGNLNQVALRMHLIADDWDGIDRLLETVDDTLQILDENGNDMRMRRLRKLKDAR